MNFPTVTNPQETSRLARTWERAQQILREGYTFWLDTDLSMVAVCKPGRLFAHYWMELKGNDVICDCPDFEKRGTFCKHTLAYIAERKSEARQLEAAEFFAAEAANAEDAEWGCCPY